MKASDFVSTSAERNESARNLLHTEETDAVNTGIVDSADESGKALKGGSVVRKAAKGGVSNAALAAVTKGRSKASGRDTGDAVAAGSPESEAMEGLAAASDGRRSLKSRLKGGAKGAGKAILASGIHKQLEGTELEGADDLYYKGRTGARLVRRVRGRLSISMSKRTLSLDGRRAARPGRPLGGLSERRSKVAKGTVEAKRKAQMTRYFKRNVYATATRTKAAAGTSASVARGLASSAGGGIRAAIAAFGGAVLPVILGLVALVLLVAALGGAGGGGSQGQTGDVTLTDTERQVAIFLRSQGLDELHTAAIMGNMYAESGVNPSAEESGGTGIGICQWSYGRATALRNYAASQGKSWADLDVQLDFFWNHDIWGGWSGSYTILQHKFDGDPAVGDTVRGSKDGFMGTDDLTEAVEQFCYGWERPGIPRIRVRIEAAERYYAALANGSGVGGQDYASAEDWQKRIVDACYTTGWPGASLCATWTTRVYAAAGYTVYGNGNSQLGHQGYGASYYDSRATTDLSQIQVGMLVSAQYGSNSFAGNAYGHVAIYIGGGQVMDSIGDGIRTVSLSKWAADYGRGWVVCGYPWDWR